MKNRAKAGKKLIGDDGKRPHWGRTRLEISFIAKDEGHVTGKEEKKDGFYADKKCNSNLITSSMINFTLILQTGEKYKIRGRYFGNVDNDDQISSKRRIFAISPITEVVSRPGTVCSTNSVINLRFQR